MKKLGPRSLASVIKVILDITFYLAIFAGVLLVIVTIAIPLIDSKHLTQNPEVSFELDPAIYHISSDSLGIEEAPIHEARGKIKIEGVSNRRMLIGVGFALILLGVVVLVLAKLREIFQTLKGADPFSPANAGRIRFIGLAVIFGELARAAIDFGYAVDTAWHFRTVGLTIRPHFEPDVVVILLGMIVLVLSEVFRLGTLMKEEQRLTL